MLTPIQEARIPGNKYFRLFACCIPVKGASRSTLCDLQRYDYELIPNDLYDMLTKYCDSHSIGAIRELYGEENAGIVDEYFSFLLENEFGFLCDKDEMQHYPLLDMSWSSPSEITNAIIDFDRNSDHDLGRIARDLDLLGCKALELRFYDAVPLSMLDNTLKAFGRSRLRTIYLKIKAGPGMDAETLEQLCVDHQRVKHIFMHSAAEDQQVAFTRTFARLDISTKEIGSASCCGSIHPHHFRVNTQLFTETQHFNSCLNRKVGIGADGMIRNCPSSASTFGHHKEKPLSDVVFDAAFRQVWNITRNQVKVCSDCEFRYICTDCRVFTQDAADLYSKPAKCNYDPYIAAWIA